MNSFWINLRKRYVIFCEFLRLSKLISVYLAILRNPLGRQDFCSSEWTSLSCWLEDLFDLFLFSEFNIRFFAITMLTMSFYLLGLLSKTKFSILIMNIEYS